MNTFINAIDNTVSFLARHWLGLLNALLVVYVGLPLMAPVFMEVGATLPARVIYTVYVPLCHQLPERSYFLFGESTVYALDELSDQGEPLSDNVFIRRRYVGDHEHGYKTALCQRDFAIYGSMLLAGFLFALLRGKLPRLSWKLYILFLIPIALDGFTQLFGLRTSNWQLRTITGIIFGIGTIWLAYPYVAEAMKGVNGGVVESVEDVTNKPVDLETGD